MKNNTPVFILIFLIVGGIAAYFMFSKSKSTLNKNAQDFAIKDTASIYKIRLSDKNGNVSVLERKTQGTWLLNEKFNAQKSLIHTLLETMKLVQVKNPVPLQARDNVIKIMATSAIKMEAYDKDGNLLKSYYVGGTTPDELGTFMLMEDAGEPFVTHIPGFFGYLTTRYVATERDWRSSEIYALNPSTIKEITVRYHNRPDASFKLNVSGNNFFVTPFQGGQAEQKISEINAKRLLAGYKSITYEQFPELTPQKSDSILASRPLITINVYAQGSTPPALILYSKKADDRTKGVGPDGTDLDEFYGVVGEGSREVVLVQSAMVAKILPAYQDLVK
ncbi:MAG: DUF4340 domain-containing protein [Bacteroidia bacterium]